MSKVTEFINKRFTEDCHWMDGNCYYFAIILKERFPYLQIVYLPITGHFMAYDESCEILYDFHGAHLKKDIEEIFIYFNDLEKYDSLYYAHIIRDCIL